MDSYNDSDDDEEVDPFMDRFVSTAPLHIARQVCYNISSKDLDKLREQGYEIERGRFTREEDKRLRKNWRRICRKFPHLNNPFEAFGVTWKPKVIKRNSSDESVTIPHKKNRKVLRNFKKIHFMRRMAYKLNDRLICDIYQRGKKIIAYKSFLHQDRKTTPEEVVDEAISQIYETKKPDCLVSAKLNINPNLIQSIKCHPIRRRWFRWNQEDDHFLELAIKRQFNNKDPKKIPTYQIDFNEAAKEMRTFGYQLDPTQLYRRWYRNNRRMVGLKNIKPEH